MGLLNGILPGEWEAQGQGGGWGQDRMQGLLSNPMFQMGVGMLSTGNVGTGAMMGINNLQQQQRYGEDRKYREYQYKKQQQEMDEYNRQQQAIEKFKTANPQFAEYADIDPKAAFKAANPKIAGNDADPFFQAIATPQGLARFNARTGAMELITDTSGKPFMKSADDVGLQTGIAAGKSFGENLYQPTDMQDGRITTKSQLAIDAGAPQMNPQLPQQLPQGAPVFPNQLQQSMQILPQEQQMRDMKRLQILQAEQAASGGQGANQHIDAEIANMQPSRMAGGIRVPTKAQLAGQEAQAKANVELSMSPQIKAAQLGAESQAKKDATMSGIGQIIDQARGLLTGKQKPTSSRFGNIADAVGASVGVSVDGAAEADALKAVGGALVAKMPRMEGPQSNFDVANYEKMAGNVADSTLPIERRLAALNEVEKLWRKYDKKDGNIMPKNEKMPKRSRADILKQYGVK